MKADVKPQTNGERLYAAIRSLGMDKTMMPLSIKTSELAKMTGILPGSVQALLAPFVRSGDVVVCKVSPATGQAYNEWRVGPGVPPPEFKPLNAKRAGIAHGLATKPLPVTTPAPKVSTPRQNVDQIEVPVLGQPQPAVGRNSGSRSIGKSPTTPSPEAPAVAAKATPGPSASVPLKKERTVRKASAGDVRCSIDDEGTVIISTDEAVIELGIDCAMRVGDFFHATEGVWRP